jgi:hypothetical protein
MGQFTEGEIIIEANSEVSADAIAEQILKLDEYIKSKTDQPFGTSVHEVDSDGTSIYVKLSSGRYPNAEWQCQQIFEMTKDLFKGQFNSFTADLIVPENVIYQEFDDEGEEI